MTAVSTSQNESTSYIQDHPPRFSPAYDDDDVSPVTSYFSTSALPKPATPGPLPNPPFVFPARPTPSAPSSISRANRRSLALPTTPTMKQTISPGADQPSPKNRPAPLPTFSFDFDSQACADSSAPRPQSPDSPNSVLSTSMRSGGHRRGGSEFIGGDGTTGNGTLLSTSPVKGGSDLPPPPCGPPAGRRGHAHRRSAAVSCHDLSMMLKPQTGSRSAPTTPGIDLKHSSFPSILDAAGSMRARAYASQPPSPEKLSNRMRVGFSDTLEFIPRPLSLATSESSSTATAKQGHSISGSLSSILSHNAANHSSRQVKRYPSPPSFSNAQNMRPSTAGAILNGPGGKDADHPQAKKASDGPMEHASSPPATPRCPGKKYIFFGHEAKSAEASPTTSRPASSESLMRTTVAGEPTSTSISVAAVPSSSSEVPVSKHRKSSIIKKTKKAKKWSILPRKTRSRSSSMKQQKTPGRRTPTGPMIEIVSPSPSRNSFQSDIASWRPRPVSLHDDDAMSSIIDLDAALGPFNTPTARDLEWEASQRGTGLRKRRMHSAAALGGFGTPYHRRAESAPQMAAFEFSRTSIHHLGSSSAMADVFEEDEEDDEWEETRSVSHKDSRSELDEEEYRSVEALDAAEMHHGKPLDRGVDEYETAAQRGLSDSGRHGAGSSLSSERSTTFLKDPNQQASNDYDEVPPSPRSGGKNSDSTMTPTLRPEAAKHLAPVDTSSTVFHERYVNFPAVPSDEIPPFPSPRSPFSYDAQRISTAPSSLAEDRSFHSLLLGEPGPELCTLDDVPSLTSSSSTMTGTFNFPPGSPFGNAHPPTDGAPQFRDGQRSASLSAAAFRKRSSVASLSRLINTSYGEKSKLSIEQQQPPTPEKKEKHSKSKRFSRKLQFWKPRDASSS